MHPFAYSRCGRPRISAIHRHICHSFILLVLLFDCVPIFPVIGDFVVVVPSMENITSAAPSSSSMSSEHRDAGRRKRKRSTPSTNCYQVFINHRGPDVKNTLASIIYHNLRGKGLQVFLDKDEFQPGQPLKNTIQEVISVSSVHVAIFSRRYAESSWCLDELCLMLKTGAPIIPVFYDVTPSDLRWIEKGGYASAFVDHEKKGRVDSQTISAWKSALSQAAGISGLDLHSDTIKGDWGQLVKSLEDAVLNNLKPVPPVAATYLAAAYPVGLDETIRDFESFIESRQQNENKEVKIVGIVGLGGSGKTTLATEFFNRKNSSFQNSSFLSDLRDASRGKALTDLQSKFLKDLQLGDHKFDSVSEGTGFFIKKLQDLTSPMLIVLDDIDHSNQVEALLGEALLIKNMLGSLIIITSRDEGALKLSGASSIYRIKALSADHAQDLFCHYAFQQHFPLGGFEDLVEKFCEKCGRLPLFLKVTGAHLRINATNDRQLWEDELQYIHEDILQVLNASYNSLSEQEKHIFLDIACFFIGEDKSLAIKVWDKCEGRGLARLNILVDKCLVEFDSDNRFKMHDHVRDFGREIADKESPCRMWNESQAAKFHEQPKAMKMFHGIMAARASTSFLDFGRFPDLQWYEPPLEETELSALKILIVKGDCFEERIGRKLKNLVWLRWFECLYTNISPWLISMKNLTILEIIGGEIKEWPLAGEQVHLRELRMVWTNVSKISLHQYVYPHLELLDLRHNPNLTEIKHLPETLVEFNLEECESVKELQSVQNLPKLRKLNISGCRKLRGLPKLQHMPSLETLLVVGCDSLQHIQGLKDLPQLRRLNICGCEELRGLPKLEQMPSLETLEVYDCESLQDIQGLEDLPQLRQLNISWCPELRGLPKLQQIPSLETLEVYDCESLQDIQGLEDLPRLRQLNISECSELRGLPKLQQMPSLETLEVEYCDRLQDIQGLEDLPQLRQLNISGCRELRGLPKLQQMPSLETLVVEGCESLQDIQGLEDLPRLRQLNISGCGGLRGLPKLQQMPSLETLKIVGCYSLQDIQGLEDLPQLRYLDISVCPELRGLPKLQQMPSLETLVVEGCDSLQDIQGLEDLPQLRKLNISECGELRWLPKLQQMPSLETLEVDDCGSLQHIRGLEDLQQLQQLNISRCPELQEFPNLAHVISLENVRAEGCGKLQGIQGLDQLEKLKSLTLSIDDDSIAICNAIEQMKKSPRRTYLRMYLSARARVNAVNNLDLPLIDSNVSVQCAEAQNAELAYYYNFLDHLELDLNRQPNWNVWEFPVPAEEENPLTCLMLCFLVQFSAVHLPREFRMKMDDINGRSIVDWRTPGAEDGRQQIYALICSRECNSTEILNVDAEASWLRHVRIQTTINDSVYDVGYEVLRGWMALDSEANILEATKKLFA